MPGIPRANSVPAPPRDDGAILVAGLGQLQAWGSSFAPVIVSAAAVSYGARFRPDTPARVHQPPRAAVAVAQLARTAPIGWQATTGIDWLETILDGRHVEFANRVWFVTNWLGELRAAQAITGSVVGPFHRVVDGLATGGDTAAVALQLLDE